jgi:hypothetical protein
MSTFWAQVLAGSTLCMSHVCISVRQQGATQRARLRTAVDCHAAVDCLQGLAHVAPPLLERAYGSM